VTNPADIAPAVSKAVQDTLAAASPEQIRDLIFTPYADLSPAEAHGWTVMDSLPPETRAALMARLDNNEE